MRQLYSTSGMCSGVAGGEEPSERVPVVAALLLLVGAGAELQRQLAIDDAQVCDVARVRKEDLIDEFEVGQAEAIAVELVFVGVRERRIAGLSERV